MRWTPSTRDPGRLPRPGQVACSSAGRAARGAAALGVALLVGCSGPPGTGRTLGADLGTFRVDATQAANDCGSNAVGSERELAFDVELSRADGELFWDGRIGGTLGPDLDFELDASVDVELRAARGALAGCTVVRDDRIAGDLRPDAAGALTAFTGEMRFDFAAAPESTCTLEELGSEGLSRLPCGMSYALSGQRTRAPTP